ncbi:P-loop containing nucleoside triphosphate hydrolase protein [Trichoderma citrinoviride]|uniref:P-loop containing nucleoside triphosphate hydrolase protein n=1 Tax=Trichoderma citrinoviride TaxID=58853 RepID=A0A2T4B114_9HYPO|nr:P-loop containing nucleoside triphosphate hydrolase protein [Trichoderma citrinoviride]PTB63012.1 P-loop containing nucleoside triphosphate hydrolase protein [Trichoderma citrinoviride]
MTVEELNPTTKHTNSKMNQPKSQQTNPETNLGFYNRVVKDEGDFAIEALVGSFDAVENGNGEMLPDDVNHRGCGPQTSLPANKLGITERISMVRIRSASVVRAIIEFGGYSRMASDKSLAGKQFLFPRPFTSFFYCQKDMKRRLSVLQRRLEKTGSGSDRSETAAPQPGKEVSDRALKKRAVEELQLYIEFVDSYIMPLWKQFDKVSDKTPRAVSYSDIPLLFKAGELAYVRPPVEIRNNPNSGIQTVFRMVCSTRDSCRSKGNVFWSVYCLDYQDGSYRALRRKIQFPHFDGLASITELPCYPLKFHPDCESLLAHRIAEGEKFRKCVEVGIRDIYYSGWTLVTGTLPNSYDGGKIPEPEHVESEVIIDFKEGLRHLPSAFFETGDGRLDEHPCEDEKPYEAEAGDAADWPEYRIWRTLGGREHHEGQENLFYREDAVHRKTWQEIEKRDKFLTSNGNSAGADFTGQDLAILPKRVPGYVLRERKFAILDVMNFETNRATEKASLDVVQMPPEHKRIIKSAVAAHFQKRHRERSHRTTSHGVDIVRGKGNGLILLLHGPPGTGKTLTAEAVALENKKPLFPITCGDLGFTPDKVEQSLKDIFRYAHLWDCILLLDEADVFLTRRNVTDIQRNALVSVFLRVLEYYSGILFLTTNRVGAIDEAFRSRIHISLNYKYLDCEDTIAILDTHLGRLPRRHPKSANNGVEEPRMIVRDHEIRSYIRQEWHKYAKTHNRERGPWNGRQIRNAVHVATCLAIYESQLDNSRDIVVLTADHFRTVGKTTDEFDDYMKRVRRADADTMARMAGERDDFDDDEAYEMARFEGFNPTTTKASMEMSQN